MTEFDLQQILKKLDEDDLSDELIYKLSNLPGGELDAFSLAWKAFPVKRRQVILTKMADQSEVDFELEFSSVYMLSLADEDDVCRMLSVRGLWENEDRALIRPLIRMLQNDRSEMVREEVAISLSRFSLLAELGKLPDYFSELVWTTLYTTIQDVQQPLDVRRRAVESIAYFDRPEIPVIIRQAYQHDEPRMRASALYAMGCNIDEEWNQIVFKALKARDPEIRFEAVRACGALGLMEGVAELSKLVADKDTEIQMMAIESLGKIGGAEAQRVLEICSEQENEALSEAAEEALQEMDFMSGIVDMSMYDLGNLWDQEPEGDEIDDDIDIT